MNRKTLGRLIMNNVDNIDVVQWNLLGRSQLKI